MNASVRRVFFHIRSLRVQGAEQIALEAVKALASAASSSRARSKQAFMDELERAAVFLESARPTEPAMRTELSRVISKVRNSGLSGVGALKDLVEEEALKYSRFIEVSKKRLAGFGARLIRKNAVVLVHCHSSSVMSVLKHSFDSGNKSMRVFCTESRPHFQGRISSVELADYGIDTTMVVDDSALFFLKKGVDVVLVGADAITERGELVNKIGSCTIAAASKESGVPFYSCTMLHKYDPFTEGGREEPIEFRDPRELVADLSPASCRNFAKVKLLNPAFDVTPCGLVRGFVTEKGVFSPLQAVRIAKNLF